MPVKAELFRGKVKRELPSWHDVTKPLMKAGLKVARHKESHIATVKYEYVV